MAKLKELTKKQQASAETLLGSINYVAASFNVNSKLWHSIGQTAITDCTINAGSEGGFWVTTDLNGENISTGTKWARIRDMFDGGTENLRVKFTKQVPAPVDADGIDETIAYTLTLPRGQSIVDNYRLNLKEGGTRTSIVSLVE